MQAVAVSSACSAFAGAAVASKAQSVARFAPKASKAARKVTVMAAGSNPVSAGYARALLETAAEKNALADVHRDVECLSKVLSTNTDLLNFLSNPIISEAQKKKLFKTVVSEAGLNQYTSNFVNVLVDKKRADRLVEILDEFQSQYFSLTETQLAKVVSAVELETAEQGLIAQKLQAMTGAKNIKLQVVVDESLIAGFKAWPEVQFPRGWVFLSCTQRFVLSWVGGRTKEL
eukprot:jgi/Mesvir1/5220/Mv15349-RA.1